MIAPADGRGGSPPPRPAAPESTPGQWFVFGPWVYDVDAATRLLGAAPRPALLLPARPWALAYGLIRDSATGPQTISLIGPGPGFDPGYAMTTDPDDPAIIATVTTAAGEPAGPLLIDGYVLPVTVRNCGHCPQSVPLCGWKSLRVISMG
jgi:hypothetical protein